MISLRKKEIDERINNVFSGAADEDVRKALLADSDVNNNSEDNKKDGNSSPATGGANGYKLDLNGFELGSSP